MVENRGKGKAFSKITSFEFNGKKIDFGSPRVMGVLNITPDSFYDGGRYFKSQSAVGFEPGDKSRRRGEVAEGHPEPTTRGKGTPGSQEEEKWREGVNKMVEDGAYIVDIGAVSTRPGAATVDDEEEKSRLLPVLKNIRKAYPELIISVDTYREKIARIAVSEGADMINDISAGNFDEKMIPFVASSGVPYIMMHIQGTPANMQKDPKYDDVVQEVYQFLDARCRTLTGLGHHKLIVDPGFGFGKTVEHNFQLLNNLDQFQRTGFPVMAGLSRKSMINRVLRTIPEDALNGTSVLNTVALLRGADILRVHDVKEAVEAVKLVGQLASWQ